MNFEQWKRRRVYVVQVFSQFCKRLTKTYRENVNVADDGISHSWSKDNPAFNEAMNDFRKLRPYRSLAARNLRIETAFIIRQLRRNGLSSKDVRAFSERIIDQPGSHGGVLGAKIDSEIETELNRILQ